MRRKPLTNDELHTIRLLRQEGHVIADIARKMRRDTRLICDACKSMPRYVSHMPGQRPAIPPAVLADRDLRLSLAPRDLTAAIFGDPLPGRSALDVR